MSLFFPVLGKSGWVVFCFFAQRDRSSSQQRPGPEVAANSAITRGGETEKARKTPKTGPISLTNGTGQKIGDYVAERVRLSSWTQAAPAESKRFAGKEFLRSLAVHIAGYIPQK
jgi:hypothetical protein